MSAHGPVSAGPYTASVRLPVESRLPSFGGATGWLNSPPLTPAGLRGKVVLAGFWTYTRPDRRRVTGGPAGGDLLGVAFAYWAKIGETVQLEERTVTMDSDVRTRDRVAEHWHASERGDIEAEHAIYAADAILDYPQSGERFRGRANIQAQRGGHPADRHFTIRRISGIGDLWVSECIITYDGVPSFSVSIMEFTEGYVTHETQYFGDKFEAASWRAPLAEPIPADGGEPGQPARG